MPSFRQATTFVLTVAFAAAPLYAQTSAPAPTNGKIVLQHADIPGHSYVVEVTRGVQPANARAPLHVHPGIESGYVVKGSGVLHIQGQPDRIVRAGDTAVVPPNTPHWFSNGPEPIEIVATYVTESGKPSSRKLEANAPELAMPTGTVAPYPVAAADANKAQTVLQSVAFPGHGSYTRITRTHVPAQGRSPQHVHPGLEITYVLSGSVTLAVTGQPERQVQSGESFLIPAGTAHTVTNGSGATELLSTYVLEEGKPAMQLMN